MVEQGSTSDDLVNLMDLFATVADITAEGLPDDKDIAPDSFSFLPSLLGTRNDHPRTSMVTADVKGMHAIRSGDWKFIDNNPIDGIPGNWRARYRNEVPRLYNLAEDPGEEVNLYEKNPEKAREMLDELNRIRDASSTR